jgi:hypothetical protein
MNLKIWIGQDVELRKIVLSMFDIEKFGGESYFNNCTDIYVYNNEKGYDIRCNNNGNKKLFNLHENKEVCIMKDKPDVNTCFVIRSKFCKTIVDDVERDEQNADKLVSELNEEARKLDLEVRYEKIPANADIDIDI